MSEHDPSPCACGGGYEHRNTATFRRWTGELYLNQYRYVCADCGDEVVVPDESPEDEQ